MESVERSTDIAQNDEDRYKREGIEQDGGQEIWRGIWIAKVKVVNKIYYILFIVFK